MLSCGGFRQPLPPQPIGVQSIFPSFYWCPEIGALDRVQGPGRSVAEVVHGSPRRFTHPARFS